MFKVQAMLSLGLGIVSTPCQGLNFIKLYFSNNIR